METAFYIFVGIVLAYPLFIAQREERVRREIRDILLDDD